MLPYCLNLQRLAHRFDERAAFTSGNLTDNTFLLPRWRLILPAWDWMKQRSAVSVG